MTTFPFEKKQLFISPWVQNPTCGFGYARCVDLNHYLINDVNSIKKDLKKILNDKKPLFVEVVTDSRQKIFDAFKDY